MKVRLNSKVAKRVTISKLGASWMNFVLGMAVYGDEEAVWMLGEDDPILCFDY